MTALNNGHRRHICRLLTLAMLGIAGLASGQTQTTPLSDAGKQIKLGILPFADATASGNKTAGADVGRTML